VLFVSFFFFFFFFELDLSSYVCIHPSRLSS
jgi:hypothetical protein